MKDGKHQFLTHNSQRLVINHYTEKRLFNIHPNYSSQWYERSSFAIGLRDWTPRHSATSRNHQNIFGHFSKVMETFLGNADKMHTKVSLLWLRKKEQFSVVLFAFLETRREFYWRRNLTRDCFWDCYWPSRRSAIGQSFSLSLVTIPELFAKVNSAEFPSSFVSSV